MKQNEYPENTVYLRFFGGLELENARGRVAENLSRPSLSWQLLKYLLLNRARAVETEELRELLWPDEEDLSGALLRVRLRRLRDTLAPIGLGEVRGGLVLYSGGKYYVNPDYELSIDEDEYKAILERLRGLPMAEPEGLRLCERALELQRGEYMGQRGEPWLEPYREHYRREGLFSAYNCLARTRLLGDNSALGLLCDRAVELLPGEEALHRAVVAYLVEQRRELELIRYITRLSRRAGAQPWLAELGK